MQKPLALLALVATVSVAAAQTVPGQSGLSARVGVFFPSDSAARALSKQWFAAGVSYKLGDIANARAGSRYRAEYGVSLDYIQRDDVRLLPLLLTYTGNLNESFYYVGGAGVTFVKGGPLGGDDRGVFGYTLGAGFNFRVGTVPTFVEARFFGSERSETNGIGLYAGVRF